MNTAEWTRLGLDALILAVAASAYVMLLIRLNPRLFLRHYPSEIRQAAPPATPQETRLGKVAGLPFILALIAWPIWCALQFAAREPAAGAPLAGAYAAAISMAFNAVDFLLLDLLWLGTLRPKWAMIPGTADVAFRLNWRDHLRGFGVGSVLALATGLLAGVAAALR